MASIYQDIHEQCELTLEFVPGKRPRPISFNWRGRHYEVTEVSLLTKAKKGATPVWMFHVATNSGAYKLRFDTDTLETWVEQVMWEE